MREAMFDVVNHPKGTARRAIVKVKNMKIAGKTGSVQVKRITSKEREAGLREQMSLPWEDRDHGLFVCFGPTKNPRYALAVVVEHGGGGGSSAAPIAQKIMEEVLRLDPASQPTFTPKETLNES